MGEKKRGGEGRKGRGAVPPATRSCCSGCLQVRRPAGGARQGLLLLARKHGRWSDAVGLRGKDLRGMVVGSALKPRERVAAAWGFGGDWTG